MGVVTFLMNVNIYLYFILGGLLLIFIAINIK